MKSIKILGIAVATLGVAASIGGAVALYTKAATNTGFGIGAGTHTGSTSTVTYKINNAVSPTVTPVYWNGTDGEGKGLNSTYKEVKYSFDLGATYANDLAQQPYVLGNLAISLTNVPEAQRGHLSVWASIEGYQSGKQGDTLFSHVFMNSDFAITGEEGHQSYTDNKDVCVEVDGTQKLVIYLKYDATFAGSDLLTADEAGLGYSLSVTWGAVSEGYQKAYVVGSGTSWAEDDEFLMYPNIKGDSYQWMYTGLPGWAQAKCKKGTTYSGGDNAELDDKKTYTVYWNGSGESQAEFNAEA